jgi:hypothetical protein
MKKVVTGKWNQNYFLSHFKDKFVLVKDMKTYMGDELPLHEFFTSGLDKPIGQRRT